MKRAAPRTARKQAGDGVQRAWAPDARRERDAAAARQGGDRFAARAVPNSRTRAAAKRHGECSVPGRTAASFFRQAGF
ncbi:hypothetical protein SAMN05192539_1002217 [Paraburkholderia diazotrophica]|uniref:Uncharacterized protein n=1 Tax=Paraburkholderia diazotrophica TaxID=667676 RepID=A0A1H6RCQ1_9BURK|nr:hypothetical protein SAMN05192539_1002217 [Paraburkholderia diazotrophica]